MSLKEARSCLSELCFQWKVWTFEDAQQSMFTGSHDQRSWCGELASLLSMWCLAELVMWWLSWLPPLAAWDEFILKFRGLEHAQCNPRSGSTEIAHSGTTAPEPYFKDLRSNNDTVSATPKTLQPLSTYEKGRKNLFSYNSCPNTGIDHFFQRFWFLLVRYYSIIETQSEFLKSFLFLVSSLFSRTFFLRERV